MHFRTVSPFGLVSMYRKNRVRHYAYRSVASIGGRSLEPAAITILSRCVVIEVVGINKARDTVMSDSKDSTVTYTAMSSPFGGLLDIGSPGVDGPPVMPEDPYAYVFMLLEDEVLPAEEQPLPVAALPTADSPGYVPESDSEEDPEEDDDEDPEEDPADYPADGGDNGDDEDESSDDDKDDDVVIEGDEKEEEHPTPVDSIAIALPAVDHAPSAEETEPFETDESAATPPPHPAYRVTARISIQDEPPTPFWSDTEVARLLAIPTSPPSPLSPWSSPLPQIPSPPLPPILPPLPAPSTSRSPSPDIILSHTRADTPPLGNSPSGTPPLLPIPLPASSPSLLLPSTDHGEDRPEVCLLPQKRLCFAFGPRYEVGESSSAAAARPTGGFKADYGFVATMDREVRRDLERDVSFGITDTWDEMLVDMPGALTTDDTKLGRRMTEDKLYSSYAGFKRLMPGCHERLVDDLWIRDDLALAEVYVVYYSGVAQQAVLTKLQANRPQETGSDYRDAGTDPGGPKPVHRGTETAEETSDSDDRKMAPKRAVRSNTAPETTNTTSVTNAQLRAMIDQGVTSDLVARDANRNTNGDDSHNSGTGVRRMESIFHISNCTVENQVKFATCTLHSVALTWWNTNVKTKLEMKIRDLKVKGTDLTSYTQCFQELALLYGRMFPEEFDKIEKYVGYLPDMIHGSVVASKPKTMQDAVEIETELIDKKIRTFAECQTESKRKFEDTSRNTQNQ
ncbi:hypothetical protein Tco_0523384 [Tanacetum coccineum]